MSASKNLGKVFMTPKGVWNKTLNYTKLDIVTNKVGKISCGYIATTDIEKNVEITDNRWLKLFELLDGDLTEEYKAVQTDVTNKATAVDTNKKAVDLIYSQMQKLYDVEISTTTPTNERTGLWINPNDISGVVNIPEIKDDEVSDVDTWSSKKIDNVTNSLKEDLVKFGDYVEYNEVPIEWEMGSIYDGTGQNNNSNKTTRIRTNGYISTDRPIHINIEYGYRVAVYPYDDDKNYISGNIKTYTSSTDLIFGSEKYIRMILYKSGNPTITLDIIKKYDFVYSDIHPFKNIDDLKLFSNYELSAQNIPVVIAGTGALYSDGERIYNADVFSHTDYIKVTPYSIITVTKSYPHPKGNKIYFYDSNKYCIGGVKINGKIDSTYESQTFYVGENVEYIRYTVTTANASSTIVTEYVLDTRNSFSKYLVETFSAIGSNPPLTKMKKSHKPIFTIVDDDTSSVYQVKTFHDLCDLYGIKGTYAVITNNLANSTDGVTVKDLLLQYEEEGFHMTTHCMEQQRYFFLKGENGKTVEEEKILVRKNLVKALRAMREAGFLNYGYWMTPYGIHDDWSISVARNIGFECAISLTQLVYEGHEPFSDRWFMPRMELYPNDTVGNQTLQDIKDEIDRCVDSNGWLSVATHMSQWENEPIETGYTRFKEMVQYALDRGMEVMTVSQAYSYWKNVYDLQDMH